MKSIYDSLCLYLCMFALSLCYLFFKLSHLPINNLLYLCIIKSMYESLCLYLCMFCSLSLCYSYVNFFKLCHLFTSVESSFFLFGDSHAQQQQHSRETIISFVCLANLKSMEKSPKQVVPLHIKRSCRHFHFHFGGAWLLLK